MTHYRQSISESYKKVQERELTPKELKRREEIAKDLPDDEFKKRYGDDWKSVKMATATKMAKKESKDQETDESGIMYRAGVKKYGKDGMKKIQSAAGKGASAEEIGKIKDKHKKKKKESFNSLASFGSSSFTRFSNLPISL